MARFIFLFSVFLSIPVWADTLITTYGVFSKSGEHLQTTDQIKMGDPVVFGFCFTIEAETSENRLTFVETIKHPLLVKANGIESIGYSVPKKYAVIDSSVEACVLYEAASSADLPTGIWEFSISQGGRDLAFQKFTVE